MLTNAISVGMMYEISKRLVFDELSEKALSVASTAAALIDGDSHRRFQDLAHNPTPDLEQNPDFKRQMAAMRLASDANRRDGTYVKYLFTLFQNRMSATPTASASIPGRRWRTPPSRGIYTG